MKTNANQIYTLNELQVAFDKSMSNKIIILNTHHIKITFLVKFTLLVPD